MWIMHWLLPASWDLMAAAEEKPVGTVWIAVGNKEKIETLKLNLRFDRQRNISHDSSQCPEFPAKIHFD